MKYIADLHPHSRYSRACSPQLTLGENTQWANWKGLQILGTGDFTHTFWLYDLKENLVEVGPGIFRYKDSSGKLSEWPLYILSVETSHIFTQGSKGRRIHLVTLAPSFGVVEKINQALVRAGGNLMSDGRPIFGLSCKEFVELILGVSEDCVIFPAHAWTPWFGIFGDKGGFDSLREAFGDYEDAIFAIETGLSSDPSMNWRISELDNRRIVSFSDAHSPWKLGREATIFELENVLKGGFNSVSEAVKGESTVNKIDSTIEFYPEEGKYHFTGHRNCGVRQSPEETAKEGEICPVCGRSLTVGVMHRVELLSTRQELEVKSKRLEDGLMISEVFPQRPGYRLLVPLTEIIAEALEAGVDSRGVLGVYHRLVEEFSSEFAILMDVAVEEIKFIGGEKVGEGIEKVRRGDLHIDPGYDGVFGKVKIWGTLQSPSPSGPVQESLF